MTLPAASNRDGQVFNDKDAGEIVASTTETNAALDEDLRDGVETKRQRLEDARSASSPPFTKKPRLTMATDKTVQQEDKVKPWSSASHSAIKAKENNDNHAFHAPEPMTLMMVAKEKAMARRHSASSSSSSEQSSRGIGRCKKVAKVLSVAAATQALEQQPAVDLGYGDDLGYGEQDDGGLGYGDATNDTTVVPSAGGRFRFHRRNSFVVPETSRSGKVSGGGGLRRHASFPWASVVYEAAKQPFD